MIKALSENPKLQFCNGPHIVKISDKTKKITWVQDDGSEDPFIIFSHAPGAVDNLHIDWELLPQEVTWQEAIQAWLNCKEIYVETDDGKYTQRASFRLGCFALGQDGFNKNCFRSGKWYITQ